MGYAGQGRIVRGIAAVAAATALGVLLALGVPGAAGADEGPADGGAYYLGSAVNTGTDNGFQGKQALRKGDPHFEWELGRFSVDGFARVEEGADGVPTFIVAPGGGVTLRFTLDQDLVGTSLNPALSVNRDENGRDAQYGVPEQDFGRGALIISRAPADGEPAAPEVTLDFLGSQAVRDEAVAVGTFGAGDYGVALDYELREDALVLLGVSVFPSFTDYRIAFDFRVRAEEGLEPGAVSAAPVPAASEPAPGEGAAAEDPAPTGMPLWQVIVMVAAISIGGLMVIRGERGPARRRGR
ncbi:hypothetical protein [Adlercreutzia faecimuris]|uniref:Uncharacterized protein n=1 Tax=Adlercreutzia faecimuris TaxID=2897341 RepID=A0ABS9WES4_9ACTN|nr:hypothetical protein [Adlercreutzia sp. JBNU-10]MCI2241369.1 hypothetical protein [Adlercreutzia sp. JBNU-10]